MRQRTGQVKVIQAVDAQYAHSQVERRLNIRRMERARLGRMLVDPHGHLENPLDVPHRPAHIQ